ncbi:4-hydroxythreonine-4-phosphate dehydrogenase [hydrothermal vent metagenome]|uniref:4-hydroxythreonine-4-phosphate dehydrogenase n=1 Tax=hydrothermal vent metagenome TaxID=652676 RepID=A0A3B0ZDV4_9ZZZZ
MKHCPRIAITPGEPAGIGPDLCLAMMQQPCDAQLIVIADPLLLQQRCQQLGLQLTFKTFDPALPAQAQQPGELTILPVPLASSVTAGLLSADNASYVLQTLNVATKLCLDQTLSALVTGPVHKGIINEGGIPFTGHTEYLATATQTQRVVMLLSAQKLRVALVTTHLPLSEVSAHINASGVEQTIQILHQELQLKFNIKQPRILVCGLNPHAGEDGHLGSEDKNIIQPAIERQRQQGIHVFGPIPADTAFIPSRLSACDVVLTMYHDQGLPVLKYVGFGSAINVTLGLPIIRTSVDHGTALELAGSGQADPSSLKEAVRVAIDISRHSHQAQQLCHSDKKQQSA